MTEPSPLERVRTICLVLIATGVVCAGLYYLKSALVPFVIAAFLHFSLVPLIGWQRRRFRFPRWLAVLSTALVGILAVGLVWVLLAMSVAQITSNIGVYQDRVTDMIERGLDWPVLDTLGFTEDELRAEIARIPDMARGLLPGTVNLAMGLMTQGVLVLLFLLFMLAGKAVGDPRTGPDLLDEVEKSINRYVLTKFFLSALTGAVTWVILAILGIEFAMVFGVLAFMLNFIPNIGSVVASLLPVPIILLGDYSAVVMILAIALPAASQFTIGNIIEPKLMGSSLGIHPVVVILSLVLFGILWGIPGMFLAVPLTAVIKIVLGKRGYSRPIARLMEGDLRVVSENFRSRGTEKLGKSSL